MKKNYNVNNIVSRGMVYITRALDEGYRSATVREGLRKLVNSYSGINRNERFWIYNELYTLYRAAKNYPGGDWHRKIGQCGSYDRILRVAKKVNRRKVLRDKQMSIRDMLDDENQIFFMCSVHEKPANDHEQWQGLIYVDRFWRTKVSGDTYYAVLSYIKNRQVPTVQWVMHDPVYMTTRPNCKHFFIPLKTDEVLKSSPKAIVSRHSRKEPVKDDYYDVRRTVFEQMEEVSPCSYFEKIIKG